MKHPSTSARGPQAAAAGLRQTITGGAGRLLAWVLPTVVLFFYGCMLRQQVFFVASDLGRHIRNGEMILGHFTRAVITTNFYSYTAPSFPVLNHHWGSGVLFYGLWKLGGITGVQVALIVARLVSLALFYDVARRRAGHALAALLSAPLVLLMAERTETRPEILTGLFCGLFVWILCAVRDGYASRRWLWVLPVAEAAWVNLHIYFFLGPAIVAAFLPDLLLRTDARRRMLFAVLPATILATLANPVGIAGALAPLTIFQNYGFAIAENQTPFFLLSRVGGTTYVLFLVIAPLLALSFLAAAARDWRQLAWSDGFLGLGALILGAFAARNLALFALFALPIMAGNLATVLGARRARWEVHMRQAALAVLAGLGTVVATQEAKALKLWSLGRPGLGVEPGNDAAAEFFRAHRMRGPIFNNFDVGGYLIYHLWPDVRVFVDNRPEAYPESFFRDVYGPMLSDPTAWARRENEFGFNAIFFTHTDLSSNAQQFLIDRFHDPDWALVFCDAFNVIFVRRTVENRALIAQFEPTVRPPTE